MNNTEIRICKYCNFYESANNNVLGKHEANCWNNPKASGKINSDWYCDICGVRFMKNKNLSAHNRGRHGIKKLQECKHCKKTWTTTDKLKILHENKCPQNRNTVKYNCQYCSRKALSELKNNEHESNCIFNLNSPDLDNITFNAIIENNINNIGIYKITTPTGKTYIGMTSESFKNRWRGHLKKLKSGTHHCAALQRAHDKYGWESLIKEIIEEYEYGHTSNSDHMKYFLLRREKEIWNIYNSDHSMLNGEPSGLGSVKHTEETRRKISEGNKKYFQNNRKTWDTCKVYFLNCQNMDCNKLFSARKSYKKYCSKNCRKKFITPPHNPKTTSPYSICNNATCCNYGLYKYCSVYCKNNIHLGMAKEIEFLYIEKKLTVRDIAVELGTTHTTIINRMKTFNITTRSKSESLRISKIKSIFSEDEFSHYYYNCKMSIVEISEFYGVDYSFAKEAAVFYEIIKN